MLAQQCYSYATTADLAVAVAQRIAALAEASIAQRGSFRLALAGGETPRHCYQQLRNVAVDWAHVQIYFSDERCLPLGDAQRNDSMADTALLQHLAMPASNIHRIPVESGAMAAALDYAQHFNGQPPLDLVLLGLGADGHTASLFPGNAAADMMAAVVPVFAAPKFPAQRVSLGLPTLQAARRRLFLVSGNDKKNALADVLNGADLPAAHVGAAEWHATADALSAKFDF